MDFFIFLCGEKDLESLGKVGQGRVISGWNYLCTLQVFSDGITYGILVRDFSWVGKYDRDFVCVCLLYSVYVCCCSVKEIEGD